MGDNCEKVDKNLYVLHNVIRVAIPLVLLSRLWAIVCLSSICPDF